MSQDSTATFHHDTDDRDMLESLRGLSIKGFHDSYASHLVPSLPAGLTVLVGRSPETPMANTPSSTNASLPTPPALRSSRVFLASPERLFNPAWYSDEPSIPPNAPLLKDLDSFTDGTGQGSFDFPVATGADESRPLMCHPEEDDYDVMDEGVVTPSTATMTNSLALDLLPSPSDTTEAVLAWIEGVSATTPTSSATSEPPPKKRRRSLSAVSDTNERRVRAWSPTVEAVYPREESSQPESFPFDRPVCENPG